ncbi:hypothetical protein EDI_140400 [Entamoeba dispar SAW760]|uniref:Uncharacterized protein n=1 Tax=Entamoeba dispar (strain ATCC PRA-260 / SAW760) TaxID=370354 RepID=B0EN49_ENTDS|nr:uncharacterized protein EDI_140400 [Entamoeba dispar SAW760]EDR24045.1 hypothetical protein EDI_140400 [Entamoeba dispar SAW760]|eukprot:EDR24045.1 hypothetical protein EDI_140400 [Entamoeba dispar SAW760]
MQNPMTPFIEEPIASYIENNDDPNNPHIEEIKVVDAERLLLKEKTIDEVANGQYIALMRKMAEKYPDKEAMDKIFNEFCQQQTNSGMSDQQKQYSSAYRMIESALATSLSAGENGSKIIGGLLSNPAKVVMQEQSSSQQYPPLGSDLMILEYQRVFKKCVEGTLKNSIKLLEKTRIDSEKVFMVLKGLSSSWKLEKDKNGLKVMLFSGINKYSTYLIYSQELKELIPVIPKKSMGYIEMKLMSLEQFKNQRHEMKEEKNLKYKTAYTNTHFNLHLLRNNNISQTVFDYFMLTNPNDIIHRNETSITVLLNSIDPFVLQVNYIPIQYTFTVKPNEVNYNHFEVYEKEPIEFIITLKQIIQQQMIEIKNEQLPENEKVVIDKKQVLDKTFNYLIMKRKRIEINKVLHEVASRYMKEYKDQLVIVQWIARDQKIGNISFHLSIYNKTLYKQNNDCEPLRVYDGMISNGNEIHFQGRDLTYLVSSEIGFIILRLLKQKC